MQSGPFIGKSMQRREDARLLTGKGLFVDDIQMKGLSHVAFLRSPYAHAKIVKIDTKAAEALDGVVAVYTGTHLPLASDNLFGTSRANKGIQQHVNPVIKYDTQQVLAQDRVFYVGETIAAVVAVSRAVAEDAVALIETEYEPLPVVVSPQDALHGSVILHGAWEDNVAVSYTMSTGNVEQALEESEIHIKERFTIQRQSSNPLETRGIVGNWDASSEMMTLWSSTQKPHSLKDAIAKYLKLSRESIRVIAQDVGGGFGPKGVIYPEEMAVAYFSYVLKRPVKWIEDRLEHLSSCAHSRDQTHEIEAGVRSDGRITGLRNRLIVDSGAHNLRGLNASYNTSSHLPGPYLIFHYESEVRVVVTNKTPLSQYRGAGRPEAVFVMERLMDMIARRTGIDPVEVRRRNMVQITDMPYATGYLYKDGKPMVYDSGNYFQCLQMATEFIQYDEFRQKQKAMREQGRYLGIGIASYVEGTGQEPKEGCRIRMLDSGKVECYVSSASQGQGHETVWAQVCADGLGIDMDLIQVFVGDTSGVQYGTGTYGSRSAVVAGNAVHLAAQRLKALIQETADGRELEAVEYFMPESCTYSNGVHAVVVEVDIETGMVQIINYVVSHDAGRIINPIIADGQIRGGVAQGIGGALLEEVVYDGSGQLLTGSLMDYLIPTAFDVPHITLLHMESLSPGNPLGVKGLGEAGTIGSPAAIANAIDDAISPFGVSVTQLPLTPKRIWSMIDSGLSSNK